MPDIFDEIEPSQAEAKQDIFDEVSAEREDLRRQMREARAEGIGGKVISGLADLGERAAYTASLMDPLTAIGRVINPYQQTPLPAEAVRAAIDFLDPISRADVVLGSAIEGAKQFGSELVSGLAQPEAALAMATGKINPQLPGRLFQPGLIKGSQQAVANLAEVETPAEAVKAGLEAGLTIGGPLGIEAHAALAGRPRPMDLTEIKPVTGGENVRFRMEGTELSKRPLKSPKPSVPETIAEPLPIETPIVDAPRAIATWDEAIQVLRERGTKQETKDQIRALFPELQLSREAAGGLAKDAWGEEWMPLGKPKPLPTEQVASAIQSQLPPEEALTAPPTTKLSPEAERALAEAEATPPPEPQPKGPNERQEKGQEGVPITPTGEAVPVTEPPAPKPPPVEPAKPAPATIEAPPAVSPPAVGEKVGAKQPWEMTAEEAAQVTGLTWDKWQDSISAATKEGKITEDSVSYKSAAKTGNRDFAKLKNEAQKQPPPQPSAGKAGETVQGVEGKVMQALQAISAKNNRKPYNPDLITLPTIKTLKAAGYITGGPKTQKLTEKGHSKILDLEREAKERNIAEGDAFDQGQEALIQRIEAGQPVTRAELEQYKLTDSDWEKRATISEEPPTPTPPTVGEPKAGKGEGTQGALATPPMVPTAPMPMPANVPVKAVSQIIRDLSKGLNVPIRFGRLTTTKFAGYFKKIPNLIGSQRANNLPVVSHEVGHKLDALYRISDDPTLAAELDALGDPARLGPGSSWTPTKSHGYKLGEGVAEFIRQWIDDPTHTASVAPNMHRYFESLLNSNHDMARVLRQAQENVRLWKTAPPLERLDSSIVRGEGPVKARYSLSNLVRDVVDDLHFLDLAVREAKKTTDIPASKDPYIMARLLRGTYGMADTFIRKGVVDFKTKAVDLGTGLEDILKPVSGRVNEFRRFIIAKRASELMSQGRNTGLQPGDVAEALRVYQNEPGFQATFDRLKQWNDALLKYAFDAGMLKPETVTAMRAMNQDYVPFHRFFEIGANELNAEQGTGIGRGLNVGTPGSLRRLKGSNRDIVDPLETMVRNAYAIITASEKNAINMALADLAEKPNMGRWVERVRTPIDPHKVTMADIRKKLEAMGADVSMIPDDMEFTFFRRAGKTPYGENIIKVIQGGNPVYYRVDGDLYETFHALDYDMASKFMRIASQPAQVLRAGVTLSPDFALRNPLRDTFSSAVISKYTMIPFLHTAKGVLHLIGLGDPKWVSEWAASGGRQSVEATYFDAAKVQKFLRDKITKEQTPADKIKNVVMSPLMAMRRFTGLWEEGTRVGQYELAYKKLIKEGVPEGDARRMAAFEARDLQDFAMGGANTKSLRLITPFWNAALQGNVRLAKAFRERPVATISKGLAFITLPKLIEQAINWNDEDYWDRPQWERDLFFMFPYGKDENGKSKFIRVPVPFEAGVIFASFPGRILQWAKETKPEAMKSFPELMLKQTVPNPIPQWAMTYFELKSPQGFSLWRNRPIVQSGLMDEAPELRYTEQNSLTARKIGQVLGMSPAKIDYAIQGTTGGIGKALTHQVSDRVIEAITGEKRTAQRTMPGGSFVTTPAGIQSESVEQFYKLLQSAKEDLSRYKAGNPTTGDYVYAAKLDNFSKRFSALRKQARASTDPIVRQRYSLQIAKEAKELLDSFKQQPKPKP